MSSHSLLQGNEAGGQYRARPQLNSWAPVFTPGSGVAPTKNRLNVNAPVYVPPQTGFTGVPSHLTVNSSVEPPPSSTKPIAFYATSPIGYTTPTGFSEQPPNWPMHGIQEMSGPMLSYQAHTAGLFTPPHYPQAPDSNDTHANSQLGLSIDTIRGNISIQATLRQYDPNTTITSTRVPVHAHTLQYSSEALSTSGIMMSGQASMLGSFQASPSSSMSISAEYSVQTAAFSPTPARRVHSTGCIDDSGDRMDCDRHSPIHDILVHEIWEHHHFETVLKEESQSPRGIHQSWTQPLMSRAYQELARLDHSRLATLKICRKIVLNLAKNFGVLPDGFDIPVEAVTPNFLPTSNGGFADIFIVRRKDTMEHVCMKRLRLFGDQSNEQRDMIRRSFCHEAVLWKHLDHANVLSFLGVNTDPAVCGPSFALISPYLVNGNVMNYMGKAQRFDPLKAVKEVADGLDYLHNCPTPVVHGDIKGANILVKDDGVCCICDFGLSVVTETFGMSFATGSSHDMKGSVPWMAPEAFDPPMLQAGQLKPESRPRDIYAFGCTMLEIFSARAPWYEHRNMISILNAVKDGKRPARPSPVEAPSLSDSIWKIIERCWAQEPCSRLTAKEVAFLFDFLTL